MSGYLETALLIAFVLFAAFVAALRAQLRYRNSALLLPLLCAVAFVAFAAKALSRIDYLRNLSLPSYLLYLDLLAGFAVGPMLLRARSKGGARSALATLHYAPCLLPLALYVAYAVSSPSAQQARLLAAANGADLAYSLLNVALFVQFSAYLFWASRRSGVVRGELALLGGAYVAVCLLSFVFSLWLYRFGGAVLSVTLVGCFAIAVLSLTLPLFPRPEPTRTEPGEGRDAEARRIAEFFASQKPYLEKRLTLASLAKMMGYNRTELSSIINSCFGKSFTRFVNGYRVEEAVRRLSDPAYDQVKVEYLGYECGFSSKGTFYTLFKEHTGRTPHFYRNGRRGRGPGTGVTGALLVLLAATLLCLAAGCGPRGVEKRLSGSYRSRTPFHGVVPAFTLHTDGTLSFEWLSNNGAHSLETHGTYEIDGEIISFRGQGLASDGDRDYDEKDTIEYAYQGGVTWSAEARRWVGHVSTDMPGWEMADDAALSLREGIDVSLPVRQLLRMKGYLFWGVLLAALFGLMHRRGERRFARS